MSLSCGSQSCRQIGRDPVAWFNPESRTHGLSSTGTMTISSQRLCAASFPRSLAAASAKAFFGTWLRSMGSKRNGAVLHLSLQTDPSWMLRPILPSCWHPLRCKHRALTNRELQCRRRSNRTHTRPLPETSSGFLSSLAPMHAPAGRAASSFSYTVGEWTLNVSLTTSNSYRKCSKRRTLDR